MNSNQKEYNHLTTDQKVWGSNPYGTAHEFFTLILKGDYDSTT